MNTAVFVVVLVAGILGLQAIVWIPVGVWFRRRHRVAAARLASEMESEGVVRPPEKASYRGATAPGYPTVKNNGVVALTRRRLVFQTATGKVIDVPVTDITGVREAKVFTSAVTAGRQHLIIQTSSGEVGFYVADIAGWVASLSALGSQRMLERDSGSGPDVVEESAGLSADPVEHARSLVGARHSPWPILAVIFTSIGLALAVTAGITTAMVSNDLSGERHADGTVVQLVGDGRYRAVVEFAAPDGDTIRFTSSVSSNPPPAGVGQHVDVLYNPDDPQDAVIDQYWEIWGLPTLFGILAAPFLLVGIAFCSVTLALRRRSHS